MIINVEQQLGETNLTGKTITVGEQLSTVFPGVSQRLLAGISVLCLYIMNFKYECIQWCHLDTHQRN